MKEGNISYTLVILRSLIEIMAHFNVGRDTVLEWASLGAPICVEGNSAAPRYSCEAAALQNWRLEQARQKHER